MFCGLKSSEYHPMDKFKMSNGAPINEAIYVNKNWLDSIKVVVKN